MNTQKQNYLNSIRGNSNYPTFRGVIGFMTLILYVLAGVILLVSLAAASNAGPMSPIGGPGILILGALSAVLVFLVARFLKEAFVILADIGDALVDNNSRVGPV